MGSRRRLLGVVRGSAFSLLFLVVLLELALRITGVARLELRARAIESEHGAPGEAVRVLHIGESTTYGLGVRPEQAYPAILEKLLEERFAPQSFASFNRGVPGLTTSAMVRTLPDKLAAVQPDLVTIMAGANDFNERLNGLRDPADAWLPAPVHRVAARLRLYKLGQLAYELSRPGVELHDGEIAFFRHGASTNILYDEDRDDAEVARVTARLEANLAELVAASHESGAVVILVGYIQSYEENRILERAAGRAGIAYVSTFLDPPLLSQELFSDDGWHPSPKGHRHIARRIAEALVRLEPPIALRPPTRSS